MKKICLILCICLITACDKNDGKNEFDNIIANIAEQEYSKCLKYAATEFSNINTANNEKTCKCAIKYIYGDTEYSNVDRFEIDFRTILKTKCGKNIPNYILKDFPDKGL